MTQEQFDKASKLRRDINVLKDKNDTLKDIIDRLREHSEKLEAQNIRIQLNDSWVATPKATIDYYDLLNFLIQQRVKNETKIEEMEEEFEVI